MLRIRFLTEEFYKQYKDCIEIEKKQNRPYTLIVATINEVDFAIPLRSNIKHKNVLWTNKENNCGLDFSKAVVILDKDKYIDERNKPTIRQNEFESLKGKDYIVKSKMERYIKEYVKAYNRQDIDRNKMLCKFSTLQYFHEELDL